ncbi:MAG TPA: NAD(P)H-dependent oxidoreductase, partial [Luteimonas sp.]
MKLLHVDSSILGGNSASRELSAAIVARWQDTPGVQVSYRDLDASPLPHLSGGSLSGADPAEAAEAARVMQEFLDADVVVVGAPMYNFGIPSSLKAWIDRLAVAGKTFHYTAN